jgi:hypothetical protein
MNDKGRYRSCAANLSLLACFSSVFEASERHHLPERHMRSICTGFGTEDSCSSSVNRLSIRTTVLVLAIPFTRNILYALA